MRISRETLTVGAVPAATMLANIASYAMLLAAAHALPKATYGEVSSLLTQLLIATIPQLGLQTAVARRVATGSDVTGFVRGTVLLGAGATAAFVVVSPLLAAFIHVHSLVAPLAVALCAGPMAALGTAMGVAQGRRAFGRLAALTLATTGVRAVGGIIGLYVGHSAASTMLGELIGVLLTCGWALASTTNAPRRMSDVSDRTRSGLAVEALHAAHAHGVFLLLTGADLLLARHLLSADAAGVYAVGSVVSRAALWLPQSVALIVFASLADPARHRDSTRRAAAIVGGIGVVCVVGCALLGPLVVSVVGGAKYHAIDGYVWQFALLGVLLALFQFSVIAGLAQRSNRRTALVWLALVAYLAVLLPASSSMTTHRLITSVDLIAAVACVIALAIALGHRTPATVVEEVLSEDAGLTPPDDRAGDPAVGQRD